MICYTTNIHKYGANGDKTGWTYIEVPADLAQELNPGVRKGYRVNGFLDQYAIKGVALLPAGDGSFILPLNAAMRKGTGKREGAQLSVRLEQCTEAYILDETMMACIADEPEAMTFFDTLTPGHRNYFSKWVQSAKTQATRERRIVWVVSSLAKQMDYGAMIRSTYKKNRLPDQG